MKGFHAILTFIAFSLFFSLEAFAQKAENQKVDVVCVGFYNLENLFDTIVDPDTNKILQDDFTPHGAKKWTSDKYQNKQKQMAKVIADIGKDVSPYGTSVLGVAEIENRAVLEDLVKQESIKERNYEIVHAESPDKRGIDVGLLYDPAFFKVTSSQSFILSHPTDSTYSTRSQLLVSGELWGEPLHFIVAHWPSRRGGEKRSQPLRVAAAQLGKSIIDSLQQADAKAKIVYMGDLNDDPTDESVRKHLNTTGKKEKVSDDLLYNPMEDFYKKGIGTLAWRDTWNLFDQIIITPSLLDESYSTTSFYKGVVYNKDYLKQSTGNYKGYPFRSYVGGQYQGGFSDHFPTYIVLVKAQSQP